MPLLKILRVAAFLALFSSPVKADAYFGARLELLLITPVIGVQLGYDFDEIGGDRFGVRASVESLVGLLNRGTLEATFRFSKQPETSAGYVGVGLGATLSTKSDASSPLLPEFHALFGYEFVLAPATGLFIEAQIGQTQNSFSGNGGFLAFAAIASGLNWHF
jgi:hypothetical protein